MQRHAPLALLWWQRRATLAAQDLGEFGDVGAGFASRNRALRPSSRTSPSASTVARARRYAVPFASIGRPQRSDAPERASPCPDDQMQTPPRCSPSRRCVVRRSRPGRHGDGDLPVEPLNLGEVYAVLGTVRPPLVLVPVPHLYAYIKSGSSPVGQGRDDRVKRGLRVAGVTPPFVPSHGMSVWRTANLRRPSSPSAIGQNALACAVADGARCCNGRTTPPRSPATSQWSLALMPQRHRLTTAASFRMLASRSKSLILYGRACHKRLNGLELP